ncbi:MAG: hypothetical protein GKR88_14365 [Flavobacteriaceae bacterium]|nr:MAG: hypothetical protein GKR88_14365 [Flavobacteriaceae bacterium]
MGGIIVAFLNSSFGQLQLERISSGSILQSIRSSDLKKIMVILPPIDVQIKIGSEIKNAVYAKAETRKKLKNADKQIGKLL